MVGKAKENRLDLGRGRVKGGGYEEGLLGEGIKVKRSGGVGDLRENR